MCGCCYNNYTCTVAVWISFKISLNSSVCGLHELHIIASDPHNIPGAKEVPSFKCAWGANMQGNFSFTCLENSLSPLSSFKLHLFPNWTELRYSVSIRPALDLSPLFRFVGNPALDHWKGGTASEWVRAVSKAVPSAGNSFCQ